MGKILVFLLFLGAGIGVYKIYEDFKTKQKAARNLWPDRVAEIMKLHTSKNTLNGELLGGETTFLQLLYLAYQIEQDGYPLLDTLKRGASQAGADATEAPLMAAAVLDNLNRARSLGAFADPANLPRMERGESPIATAPGWEDERLMVGYKLSPLFGAELSTTLSNMVVMPEAIRDMQTDITPPEAANLVNQWLGARMISPECASAVRMKVEEDSRVR